MNVPTVDLAEREVLLRTSNRLVHDSPGPLSAPCGFFAEVVDKNGHSEVDHPLLCFEMSSIAGSPEARARKKFVEDEMEYVDKREHGRYTHEYYRAHLDHLKLLEWFRRDGKSAESYVEGGFPDLLAHCKKVEEIFEESFPEPSEIYDHIPDSSGIKGIYGQVFKVLREIVLEGSPDLETALVAARLRDEFVMENMSHQQMNALGVKRDTPVNLHDIYTDRCGEFLDLLEEINPIIEKFSQGGDDE